MRLIFIGTTPLLVTGGSVSLRSLCSALGLNYEEEVRHFLDKAYLWVLMTGEDRKIEVKVHEGQPHLLLDRYYITDFLTRASVPKKYWGVRRKLRESLPNLL